MLVLVEILNLFLCCLHWHLVPFGTLCIHIVTHYFKRVDLTRPLVRVTQPEVNTWNRLVTRTLMLAVVLFVQSWFEWSHFVPRKWRSGQTWRVLSFLFLLLFQHITHMPRPSFSCSRQHGQTRRSSPTSFTWRRRIHTQPQVCSSY